MSHYLFIVGFALALFCANSAQSEENESFTQLLNQVERRDLRTKAIIQISVVDANGNAESLGSAKMDISGSIATFEFSRRYKTGTTVKRFQFPVTREVSLEVTRFKSLQEMLSLKAKADAAMNAYQVFVTSDFRIRVGDTLETADIQMGMRRKEHESQPQWAMRTLYVYEDGLVVDSVGGVVRRVWRDEHK